MRRSDTDGDSVPEEQVGLRTKAQPEGRRSLIERMGGGEGTKRSRRPGSLWCRQNDVEPRQSRRDDGARWSRKDNGPRWS